MILKLILLTTFMSLFLIFYSILHYVIKSRRNIASRLDKIAKEDTKNTENEFSQPLFSRVVKPILDDISKTVLKVTPKEFSAALEKKVVMAGNPYGLTVKDWINFQVIMLFFFPVIILMLKYYRGLNSRTALFLGLTGFCVSLVLPNLLLNSQISKRQKEIKNSLPDFLDILTVSVEAGLGFDAALLRVVEKMPGPLAGEFSTVLQEMKMGKQKRDALRSMADRVGIPDLSTFIGSVIQADQLGVSVGNVLRIQAEQMRQKRRQRAQERAMKAPVKMILPMILFIFPTVFLVVIGPVVIRAVNTLAR